MLRMVPLPISRWGGLTSQFPEFRLEPFRVAPLAAQGLSLEAVQAKVDYSAQIRLFAGDSAWARRWLEAYWLEPITSSAWREAKGIPIEPGG